MTKPLTPIAAAQTKLDRIRTQRGTIRAIDNDDVALEFASAIGFISGALSLLADGHPSGRRAATELLSYLGNLPAEEIDDPQHARLLAEACRMLASRLNTAADDLDHNAEQLPTPIPALPPPRNRQSKTTPSDTRHDQTQRRRNRS